MSSFPARQKPASVLNWLDRTFADPDMQAAYEKAKLTVQEQNQMPVGEREARKQALLRWMTTPMDDPDMEQARIAALVDLAMEPAVETMAHLEASLAQAGHAVSASPKDMGVLNRLRGWVGL